MYFEYWEILQNYRPLEHESERRELRSLQFWMVLKYFWEKNCCKFT